jgi:hypothetical protein
MVDTYGTLSKNEPEIHTDKDIADGCPGGNNVQHG